MSLRLVFEDLVVFPGQKLSVDGPLRFLVIDGYGNGPNAILMSVLDVAVFADTWWKQSVGIYFTNPSPHLEKERLIDLCSFGFKKLSDGTPCFYIKSLSSDDEIVVTFVSYMLEEGRWTRFCNGLINIVNDDDFFGVCLTVHVGELKVIARHYGIRTFQTEEEAFIIIDRYYKDKMLQLHEGARWFAEEIVEYRLLKNHPYQLARLLMAEMRDSFYL